MKENKSQFKFKKFMLFFASIFALPVLAAFKPITCKTNFGEKSFTIQGNGVAFHQNKGDGRSISSVLASTTQKSHSGFKKTLYNDGSKHLISIKDLKHFDSKDDFLAITSPRGHKMTFPLNCSLVE